MKKTTKNTNKGSILEKILNNKQHSTAKLISEVSYFNEGTKFYKTRIPLMNIALSGKFDGGLSAGLTILAGPSRHFKTNFGLVELAAFLDADPENYAIIYDSERGLSKTYLESYDIDIDRVVYVPILTVEDLTEKMASLLNDLERNDKVMFFVDSVGNLPSTQELQKAIDGKITADMQRAKAFKSFTRIVSGSLKFKEICALVIGHTYNTLEMFSKAILGGGTGLLYSADTVLFVSRSKDKDEDGLNGYKFTLKAEKSRFIQEESKFPITVSYDYGIHTYSGLIDLLHDEFSMCEKVNIGRSKGYKLTLKDGREIQTSNDKVDSDQEFWDTVFKETDFKKLVEMRYSLGKNDGVLSEELESETV